MKIQLTSCESGARILLIFVLASVSWLTACGPVATAEPAVYKGTNVVEAHVPQSTPISDPLTLLDDELEIQAELQDDAYPLPQATLETITSYDEATGDITIPADAEGADQIQVGQVIVGGVSAQTPHGLLRRVIVIEEQTVLVGELADATGQLPQAPGLKQLILRTVQARLQDLFKRAQVKDSRELSYDMLDLTQTSTAGLDYDPAAGEFILEVSETLSDPESGATASLNGRLFIRPQFEFNLVFDDGLKYAAVRNVTTLRSQVEMTAGVSFHASAREPVYELYFQSQLIPVHTPIGTIPVYYQPVIRIFVGADGSFTTEVSFSAEQEVTYQRGYIYNGADWYEDKPEPVRQPPVFSGPDVTVAFQARAYVAPRLEIIFYGIVGWYAEAEVYLLLEVEPTSDPWWILNAGVIVYVGYDFQILGDLLPNYREAIIKEDWELARADLSPPPPTPTPDPRQSLLDEARDWPLVYEDWFDSSNVFSQGSYEDELVDGYREYTSGVYQWTAHAKSPVIWWEYTSQEVGSDFYLYVQARQISGDDNAACGAAFRYADYSNFYTFVISASEQMRFFRKYEGKRDNLIDWEAAPGVLPQGNSNQLEIIGLGGHYYFYVNGGFLGEYTDDKIGQGRVGIAIDLRKANIEAEFAFEGLVVRIP